jgi:hypothetical protein
MNKMFETRITLGEIAKRLTMHAEAFGDRIVSSIGYTSNHYHVFTLRDERGHEMELKIPMYENMPEAYRQAKDGDEIKENSKEQYQYILLYACETNFSKPKLYCSKEAAFDAMISEFSSKSGLLAETLKKNFSEGTLDELSEEFRDDYGIEDESAWIMDGENHDNHIWKIYRCTMKGNQIAKCE